MAEQYYIVSGLFRSKFVLLSCVARRDVAGVNSVIASASTLNACGKCSRKLEH